MDAGTADYGLDAGETTRRQGRILCVLHQATSDTGRVGRELALRGYEIETRCAAAGQPLPESVKDYAGVVIFGGPMSANDDHLDFIPREMTLIEQTLKEEVPFLGLCLGAQLLTRALGGTVAPHADGAVEIGFHPIYATPEGRDLFGDGMVVYQWHREGVLPPPGAVSLAHSDRFHHQAFQVGASIYGLQFHCELTTAMMNRWLVRAQIEVERPGAQTADVQLGLRPCVDPGLRRWLVKFVDRWLETKSADVPRT